MKICLTLAAAVAASVSAASASAMAPAGGHYEWQYKPHPGSSKSLRPDYKRVWIKDASGMANCDCTMMQDTASAADCMAMPHKGDKPANG